MRQCRHSDSLTFEPRNPDYVQRVREAFAGQAMLAALGVELCRIEPGFCELQLPYRQDISQNHGYFHGGAIATLADVSGGFAGWSLLPEGMWIVTVEYKTNMVAPGRGERLIGRGRVVRAGRSLTTTEIEILAVEQGREMLCATALQTLMAVRAQPEGG
ncbi:PaaI family thioesterase [Sedimenticola hydrogenitrophicus]|uniref:PaaI family thioesterase n=1 Tax=Sedimenticola hydrogenitrophicus TaxID=2967975 RepID=UPI0023B0B7ED|nr:PaaI family thioesterase [Sedimenticola hydrogenitrophicus]